MPSDRDSDDSLPSESVNEIFSVILPYMMKSLLLVFKKPVILLLLFHKGFT